LNSDKISLSGWNFQLIDQKGGNILLVKISIGILINKPVGILKCKLGGSIPLLKILHNIVNPIKLLKNFNPIISLTINKHQKGLIINHSQRFGFIHQIEHILLFIGREDNDLVEVQMPLLTGYETI
jgi:hypothetical protein